MAMNCKSFGPVSIASRLGQRGCILSGLRLKRPPHPSRNRTSSMPRVLVTPTILRNVPGLYCDTLLQGGFEVVYPPDGCDTMRHEELLPLLANVDAMLASVEKLTREVLAATKLRAIARMGVGYDSVDTAAATDLGIAVTITPGTLEESVAEHTVALMLGVSRGLVQRDREVRSGHWSRVPMPRMMG